MPIEDSLIITKEEEQEQQGKNRKKKIKIQLEVREICLPGKQIA
jgi:hypothetical protein